MFFGILAALLTAVVVAALIITMDIIFEALENLAAENGDTGLIAEAQDLIAKALDEAISAADKVALSQLKKKAGTAGKAVAPVKNGKIVRDKLTIISSDQQDQETQEFMQKHGGVILADLKN